MRTEHTANWTDVIGLDELPDGGVKGVKVGEQHIAVYRLNGQVHATSDVCTHEFALLSGGWVEDGVIECPLHGARFNIVDGRCLGPCGSDLRCFEARVREGRVEVRITDAAGCDVR
jgi:nitrite reductase/ring-hydroxylating ferredoxin subunit